MTSGVESRAVRSNRSLVDCAFCHARARPRLSPAMTPARDRRGMGKACLLKPQGLSTGPSADLQTGQLTHEIPHIRDPVLSHPGLPGTLDQPKLRASIALSIAQ